MNDDRFLSGCKGIPFERDAEDLEAIDRGRAIHDSLSGYAPQMPAREYRDHARWYRQHGMTVAARQCERFAKEIEDGERAWRWAIRAMVFVLAALGAMIATHAALPFVR